MKKNNWGITVIVAVVVAVIAFFGGMQYQKGQAGNGFGGGQYAQGGQGGAGGPGGRMGPGGARFGGVRGGGATVGQVVSQDASSITVKLQDGSSKIINTSGTTKYSKTDTAAVTDIKVGDTIAAIGTTNSDGSITAQNIQLNPSFNRMGGGGRGPAPTQ